MKNLDLITDAIKAMSEGNNDVAESRLKQFIALNTPRVNGGKFKIYDWCDYKKKEYRPSMYGIFHDPDGIAVATNTKVLVVSRPDFNPEKSGEVIDIKGDIVDSGRNKEGIAIFPAWRRVIATKLERRIAVDTKRLADLMKRCGVMMLLNGKYNYTTAIRKNLTSKQGDVVWRTLVAWDAKRVWEMIRLSDIDFDKYLPSSFYSEVIKFSEKWEKWLTDEQRRNKYGCKTAKETLDLLTRFFLRKEDTWH